MPKTTLIVPRYNEERRLSRQSFVEFSEKNPEVQFLFVNDGSKDKTLQVLKDLCQERQNCSFLDLPQNQGKAEAVRQGILQAMTSNSSYVGYWVVNLTGKR